MITIMLDMLAGTIIGLVIFRPIFFGLAGGLSAGKTPTERLHCRHTGSYGNTLSVR
jgi:hypothetical protein